MASLTDDNAVLAGIASAHYCDINATLYKMPRAAKGTAGRSGNGRKRRDTDGSGNFFYLYLGVC